MSFRRKAKVRPAGSIESHPIFCRRMQQAVTLVAEIVFNRQVLANLLADGLCLESQSMKRLRRLMCGRPLAFQANIS